MSQTKQFDFSLNEVTKLLAMQDQLNSYIHPQWKAQNFDWHFAIIDECREIKEHLGWKWWKNNYQCGLTDANRKQVQLEVIDILHFVLSIAATVATSGPNTLIGIWNSPYLTDLISLDRTVKFTMQDALYARNCHDVYDCWSALAHCVGLTKQEILETYVQKYVLNKFRQDHGYKDGSYQKVWGFETCQVTNPDMDIVIELEDNEVLTGIVSKLLTNGEDTTDETVLYTQLKLAYTSRLNQ